MRILKRRGGHKQEGPEEEDSDEAGGPLADRVKAGSSSK
jgi:hypothetical protein